MATDYTWPANVTNKYANGDTSAVRCDAVLGEACRRAIEIKGANSASTNGGGCDGPATPWVNLPECADSFGYAHNIIRFPSTMTYDLNAYSGTKGPGRNGTLVPGGTPNPTSGTGFFAFNSYPRNATNETDYY